MHFHQSIGPNVFRHLSHVLGLCGGGIWKEPDLQATLLKTQSWLIMSSLGYPVGGFCRLDNCCEGAQPGR